MSIAQGGKKIKDRRDLGLTTAYSIVKNHGGYISVESKVGVGTTCHVYLPAVSKAAPPARAAAVKAPERAFTGKGKILIMDDEELVTEVAGEMLNPPGVRGVCGEGRR